MPLASCRQCSQHIEFPVEMAGQEVACPTCGVQTMLASPETPAIKIPAKKPRFGLSAEPRVSAVNLTANRLIDNVEKVIVGKREKIVLALVAYFSEGHILLEDVPGVAKTMLARSLAQSVGGT